jgi:hypothetical protein
LLIRHKPRCARHRHRVAQVNGGALLTADEKSSSPSGASTTPRCGWTYGDQRPAVPPSGRCASHHAGQGRPPAAKEHASPSALRSELLRRDQRATDRKYQFVGHDSAWLSSKSGTLRRKRSRRWTRERSSFATVGFGAELRAPMPRATRRRLSILVGHMSLIGPCLLLPRHQPAPASPAGPRSNGGVLLSTDEKDCSTSVHPQRLEIQREIPNFPRARRVTNMSRAW